MTAFFRPVILGMVALAVAASANAESLVPSGGIVPRVATLRTQDAGAIERAVPIALDRNAGEIRRAPDGLFYVDAMVNGASVRFLVDTGASMIVLTAADAQRAGIWLGEEHFSGSAETANGTASMARVVLNDLAVGPARSRQVAAAVVRSGLSISLLGQNWLSQLQSVTISGDKMVLR